MKAGRVQVTLIGRNAEEQEPVITRAEGYARQATDGWHVQYEEIISEGNAAEHIYSMLCIGPEAFILNRSGMIESTMHFQEGQAHEGEYRTPYGAMPMQTQTHHLEMLEEEEKLEIRIEFGLCLGGKEQLRHLQILIEKTDN